MSEVLRIVAPATQVLEGMPISVASDSVYCSACNGVLGAADPVVVCLSHDAAGKWVVSRVLCGGGRHGEPGASSTFDLTARARVGSITHPSTREHRLCLTEVEVLSCEAAVEEGADG